VAAQSYVCLWLCLCSHASYANDGMHVAVADFANPAGFPEELRLVFDPSEVHDWPVKKV
jgi:hypothetical protein